jgi:NADPH-dependent 2,4-dienoyl-CoA reductase/sulfur reductase-like enzyme
VRTVVVVGGGLAALSAVEALREEGFDGRVVVVGAEPHLPYDRPPLSKQVLAGTWPAERAALRDREHLERLEVDWELGRRAIGLDPLARTVRLDDGRSLGFDGLVVATGARPRRVRGLEAASGAFVLRTIDDATALAAALDLGPSVCVVGGGFIGAEVAATCRERGLEVTLVEAAPVPLAAALGEAVGHRFACLHRDHGVHVRTGVTVAQLRTDADGAVAALVLTDGTVVEASVVVVGVGVEPETEWLEGSGLPVADGLRCDATCATPAPGIVAAGDVARAYHPLFDEELRLEHWDTALEQGRVAALRLLEGPSTQPHASVPYFWSDQYGRKLQVVGRSGPEAALEVLEGDPAEARFFALYGRGGVLTGAVGIGRPRLVMQARALVEARVPLAEAVQRLSQDAAFKPAPPG